MSGMDNDSTDPADRAEIADQDASADARQGRAFEDGVPREGEVLAWADDHNPWVRPAKPPQDNDTAGEAKEPGYALELESPEVEPVPAVEVPSGEVRTGTYDSGQPADQHVDVTPSPAIVSTAGFTSVATAKTSLKGLHVDAAVDSAPAPGHGQRTALEPGQKIGNDGPGGGPGLEK